jgi:hypothetical protein
MNSTLKLGLAALGLSCMAAPAFAQTTASATGSTTIIRPLTVSKTADLGFGKVIRGATDSTVVLNSGTGAVTISAGDAVAVAGSGAARATYTISGEGGQVVTINYGALAMSNGTDTLTATVTGDLGASTTLSGAIGDASAGTATLRVGGSFPLPSTTSSGLYTGSFDVTVAYQ